MTVKQVKDCHVIFTHGSVKMRGAAEFISFEMLVITGLYLCLLPRYVFRVNLLSNDLQLFQIFVLSSIEQFSVSMVVAQFKTMELSKSHRGINPTNSVVFPRSLVLRSIVLG